MTPLPPKTDTPDMANIRRAGFVAMIGSSNAGKSTLVNRLVGSKVAIVTHKVQTTRFPIRGVAHIDHTQLVLVDTPGIFQARKRLDRAMVKAAWNGAEDADAIVQIIDAAAWIATHQDTASPAQKRSVEDDKHVFAQLRSLQRPAFLALNKIDLFPHDLILPLMNELRSEDLFSEIFMVSALKGDGVMDLGTALAATMPDGTELYPPDQTADLPLRLMAAEATREKLMLRLHQELPYQLMVETETWEPFHNGSVKIRQAVIIAREQHKGMILGKGGRTIKAIGQAAREEISNLIGQPVHLVLFVKVDAKWQERRDAYASLGLEFDA